MTLMFGRSKIVSLTIVLLFVGVVKVTQSAAAQAESGIVGIVTDESGGVLPGVTVTASSPALQIGQVTTVTNERGDYRLSPLPIRTYTVIFNLARFQTIKREDIRLTVGFVAKVDAPMK